MIFSIKLFTIFYIKKIEIKTDQVLATELVFQTSRASQNSYNVYSKKIGSRGLHVATASLN